MHSGDLNHGQLAILRARIAPAISYLEALRGRMQSQGFPPDDKLAVRVLVAHDALQQMRECLEQLELSRSAQKDYMRGIDSALRGGR